MVKLSITCYSILILPLAVFSLAHSHEFSNLNEPIGDDILQHEEQIKKSSSQIINAGNTNAIETFPSRVSSECILKVKTGSVKTFQDILNKHRPHFIQFRMKKDNNHTLYKTTDVFQPGRWYWTFGLMSKPNQFLSWNLRYGLFTFGLLDFKTSLVPTVFIRIKGNCNLTLGTEKTSELITKALTRLINVDSAQQLPRQYKENYFCYLSVKEDLRNTFEYIAAVYFLYPIKFIDYKCCFLKYNFTNENFTCNCSKEITHVHQWDHVITFNMILGIVIIALCPLPFFRLFAWLGENDEIEDDEQRLELMNDLPVNDGALNQVEWIFANGKHPLTFFDVMSFQGIGIDKIWPLFVSRLRRFICLILAPSVIYIELFMNSHGIGVWEKHDKITIKDFVNVGAPMGFMSLLGNASNRHKVFVPILGGPVVIAVLYFVLGFFYMVCPKSLKTVVYNGLPTSDAFYDNLSQNTDDERRFSQYISRKSPLFFGVKEIITLSQINVDSSELQPGYSKCYTMMRCNFYMLFTMKFWCQVWNIQAKRLCYFRDGMPLLLCLLCVPFIPIYIAFCLIEMLLCILYYGVPFFFFLIVMVRAAMRMIPYLKRKHIMFSYVFRIRFIRYLGSITLLISILLFAYCIFLLIVSSFKFISQIITYCFIAVIMFPSVSFGNLFLFFVIVYYIIRQLKLFSYSYTSLLYPAVAISKDTSETHNHVTCFNGHLIISNVRLEDIREVEINGQLLDASQNVIISNDAEKIVGIEMEDNCYGIPTELYQMLIRKYRPIHKQVLLLLFRVSVLISCVLLFLSITQSYQIVPDDQITEVLHVIFIITVGALPKLIESDLVSHFNAPTVKIEKKLIEQTVIEFWAGRQ